MVKWIKTLEFITIIVRNMKASMRALAKFAMLVRAPQWHIREKRQLIIPSWKILVSCLQQHTQSAKDAFEL